MRLVGVTGLEPTGVSAFQDKGLRNRPNPSGAESGAVSADSTFQTPDLQAVTRAWPGLSEAVRTRILAMIRAFEDGGQGTAPSARPDEAAE